MGPVILSSEELARMRRQTEERIKERRDAEERHGIHDVK